MTSPVAAEMKEGRELDAEIHTKVFGEPAWDVVIEGYSRGNLLCHTREEAEAATPHLRQFYRIGAAVTHYSVPHFSTDIGAAWGVVERMREIAPTRFKNLQLVAYCYNRTYATFDVEAFQDYDDKTWVEANGENATPLAICKASLAALRGEGREK